MLNVCALHSTIPNKNSIKKEIVFITLSFNGCFRNNNIHYPCKEYECNGIFAQANIRKNINI